MIKMNISASTHIGMVRNNNEDTFICQHLWDEQHVLCVAIDGLGGYEGGEIAAAIAKGSIVNYLINNRMGNLLDLLKQAVTQANNDIVAHQIQKLECNRMGCVLTAGLFDLQSGCLNVAHVGDARLYQWHDGTLRKLTHDHSLVGYSEDSGLLTEEEAMNHPQRNIVERFLGDRMHHLEDQGFIESAIFPLQDGMSFIFCSDGLTDMITSAEISLIVQNNENNLEDCVNALIKSACDHGGNDNVTVVMARYCNDQEKETVSRKMQESVSDAAPYITPPVFRDPSADALENIIGDTDIADASDLADSSGLFNDEIFSANSQPEPKRIYHFLRSRIVVTFLLVLTACLLAIYGSYRMGYSQHNADLEADVLQLDSIVTVLQDSIKRLEENKNDQSVKMDSINNP